MRFGLRAWQSARLIPFPMVAQYPDQAGKRLHVGLDVLVRRAAWPGFHRAMASKVPPPGRDGKGRTTTRG